MIFNTPVPMTLAEFRKELVGQTGSPLRFRLPTGGLTPIHLHLTEIAQVDKRFIDCGGTVRTQSSARLQLWTADDTDHRVDGAKALQILDRATGLLSSADLALEVEYDFPFLTVFTVVGSVVEDGQRIFILGGVKTDCLAPEFCLPQSCKPGSGCC
ncbi:MAG TPA: hypothetical protein DCY41_05895 [Opitutae bacterium]|nr:hypothetical protein [Opitutae bacterium]